MKSAIKSRVCEQQKAQNPPNPKTTAMKAAPALDARKTTPMEGGLQGMEMARKNEDGAGGRSRENL